MLFNYRRPILPFVREESEKLVFRLEQCEIISEDQVLFQCSQQEFDSSTAQVNMHFLLKEEEEEEEKKLKKRNKKKNKKKNIEARVTSPGIGESQMPFNGIFIAECSRSFDLICIQNVVETKALPQHDGRVKFLSKILQLERSSMAVNKYYTGDVCIGAALLSRSFVHSPQVQLDEMRDDFMKHYGQYFPIISKIHEQNRFFITHELRN